MRRSRQIVTAILVATAMALTVQGQVDGPNRPPTTDPTVTSVRVQTQSDLETRIARLKSEHRALMDQLQAILDTATKEKATKTAQLLRSLIAERQQAYDKELEGLQSRLNRLRKALSDQDKKEMMARRAGTSAPLFRLTDHQGNTVELSDYKGKVVVLEWVDPNCPFWRYHANSATLKRLAEQYRQKDVIWLGINSRPWSNHAQNKRIVTRFGLPYPVLDDHTGKIARQYMATNTPYVVIVGSDGMIVYNGAIDNAPLGKAQGPVVNYVSKALGELLEGKPISINYARPYGTPIPSSPDR